MVIKDQGSRLASGAALPGWLILAWFVTSQISTTQTAIGIVVAMFTWFDQHQWVGFLLGILVLVLVVVWPGLKAKSPRCSP